MFVFQRTKTNDTANEHEFYVLWCIPSKVEIYSMLCASARYWKCLWSWGSNELYTTQSNWRWNLPSKLVDQLDAIGEKYAYWRSKEKFENVEENKRTSTMNHVVNLLNISLKMIWNWALWMGQRRAYSEKGNGVKVGKYLWNWCIDKTIRCVVLR